MRRINNNLWFFLVVVTTFSNCSRKIYIDRSQFFKDGEAAPGVDLSYYKSVQLRPHQDSTLAVAMAISGGGSRAANFGLGIMLGLEELLITETQDALDQVDYFSTVSGGGFGAGAYICALYDHHFFQRQTPFSLSQYADDQICGDLCYSYAGALIRGNLNVKLWFSLVDDGDALEKAIDDQVLGYKRRREAGNKKLPGILLGDLFVPKGSDQPVLYPMHITNSTALNTMTIFPFTPDILNQYQIYGYTHRLKTIKDDNLDVFSMPLSVGIKSSGSFPVLISNTTLRSCYSPERPYLHLIDGAMTDNTGYYTALDILRQDESSRKILIIVDADASGNLYTFSKKEAARSSLGVLFRLPASGLYARRSTLQSDIETRCQQYDVTPIYFSFSNLIKNNPAEVPHKIDIKKEMDRLLELMQLENFELSPYDQQILYEVLIHIGTKYTMKEEEQLLLMLTGRMLVRLEEEKIYSYMSNN
ncbi:MAG TPA: patatin-like phospholipase family protein [Saprospiraceae bacterium]|nr:patatin-like phospholipase family protein [Saprospiraceae bacterium]HMQ83477.1 patatin-like phospholipase family protein [Saprospiraceae bacterium]